MYTCLACGYPSLGEPLWDGDSASDQICPCCGLHYGYDDAAQGRGDPASGFYAGWRGRWVMEKCPWFSASTRQPSGWSGKEQVRQAFGA